MQKIDPINFQHCWTLIPRPKKEHMWFLEGADKIFIYYIDRRINLNTGEVTPFTLTELKSYLNRSFTFDRNYSQPIMLFLYYELGMAIVGGESWVTLETPLLLEVHFQQHSLWPTYAKKKESGYLKKEYVEMFSAPCFSDYQKNFERGYQELLKGNCYQFNLTYPFLFRWKEESSFTKLLQTLWSKERCAPYSYMANIPQLKKNYLSHSPETLFSVVKKGKDSFYLQTRPIKGTASFQTEDEKKWAQKELFHSIKDQGELYMITDLLRNDLSRIERPQAKVIIPKKQLIVPGLVHQYSLIEVELSYQVGLGDILWATFPGGSITGAPKKRSMELLTQLENRQRDLYTGSTILFYKDYCDASINIRTAIYDHHLNIFTYSAGGGVTLLSKVELEFQEMVHKVESFWNIFTS